MDFHHSKGHVCPLVGPFKLNLQRVTPQHTLLHKTVINLSQTLSLTPAQLQLLDKGLSFIPSHLVKPYDRGTLLADLGQFHKRIQRAVFFGPNSNSGQALPFCEKSTWIPPPQDLPGEIWDFFDKNCTDLRKLFNMSHSPPPNLSQAEIEALDALSHRRDIIIKPADKGNAIVIMDTPAYVQEALRQLQDTDFYKKLTAPIFHASVPRITKIVQELFEKGYICKRQANYLLGQHNPRPRRFYLLPKVHKPRDKWSTPTMPPGRPIISDCGSESYRIAELIDFYLNPLSTKHASYIKDTYDFVDKVKKLKIPPNAFLFSLDVDSLYTNIETPLGLKAIRDCFNKHPDTSRPDEAVLELLELSLTCNDFEFGKEIYLQTKGTAMGKKFAPAYANIYMAQWEETVFPKCTGLPYCYYRYIDDVWGVWQYSHQDFQNFIQILNSHHRSIKVKSVANDKTIDFLDTTTYKGTDFSTTYKLDLKVFFKETDTHALLHHNSYHPPHTFQGIVKSQLLRFTRICTQTADFQEAKNVLFAALRNRGYSRTQLRKIYKEFCQSMTKGFRRPQEENKILVPIIFPYSSLSVGLSQQIKENFSQTLRPTSVGDDVTLLPAYKRNTNLRDVLVSSRLPRERKQRHTGHKHHIIKVWGHQEAFFLPNIPLNTQNCVYAITCLKCRKQYVGQTKNSIRTRLHHHRYTIRSQLQDIRRRTLIDHFHRHGVQNLFIQGLEHNPTWSDKQRRHKEFCWIQKLKTKFPNGLNEREGSA